MLSPIRAVHVALSWLTVLPLPQPTMTMDRRVGAAVMAAVPFVGAVLGVLAAGFAAALALTDLPAVMIGLLVVAALALVTRGMHIDGLADTADGLGCYGPPERVAEVMKSGTSGPFGVAAVVVVLAVQAVGFGALTQQHRFYDLAFAIALGRLVA
ncbi:MAG: adenosylcobinamide-GDP ribazoletransferase, partial [Actinomycetota bacterium]|nr:adenosylcobinamide-GDP ribazoletransferase [Actinomycetota bacterium]